jgi:hypothetical protein
MATKAAAAVGPPPHRPVVDRLRLGAIGRRAPGLPGDPLPSTSGVCQSREGCENGGGEQELFSFPDPEVRVTTRRVLIPTGHTHVGIPLNHHILLPA